MTDVLGDEPVNQLESDIASALRRRPVHEGLLAGTLRELAPFSARLRAALERAAGVLVKRASYQRLLYRAAIHALAECAEKSASPHLLAALASDEVGGLATLSAAAMVRDATLALPLARAAGSRHPHLAFAAELARLARGETSGEHSLTVAPKIKESTRILLCSETLVPLLWRPALPAGAAAGLGVLRQAERHIGRWRVLGEIGVRAGDGAPVAEAVGRSERGAHGTRAAWTLVLWALDKAAKPPAARPTLQVLARLSDRPSADRDATFLFRMGDARLPSARPILEGIVKEERLTDALSIRAALILGRCYRRDGVVERLIGAARSHRQESLRGLAAAALFDLGEKDLASRFADELVNSRKLPTLGWAALIRAGGAGKLERLVTEPRFRRVQRGWVQ